jgi:hypothetical protein
MIQLRDRRGIRPTRGPHQERHVSNVSQYGLDAFGVPVDGGNGAGHRGARAQRAASEAGARLDVQSLVASNPMSQWRP